MKEMVYRKLVRDRIPDIIKAEGKIPETRILGVPEYIEALEAKLLEEVHEYLASREVAEIADIHEVLNALCIARGIKPYDLDLIRQRKVMNNGAFVERIFLERVVTDEV